MNDFTPIRRSSVSSAVFEQLAARILNGELLSGTALPPERSLTEALGVNRQALREALQRLDQLGLVAIRHGDATRVLDYRLSAGLDLLPRLFLRPDGTLDPAVVRSVMEMRSAIGSDAAALCAARADATRVELLRQTLAGWDTASDDDRALLDARFWDLVVDGSDNICYRLSLNALREAYRPAEAMVTSLLAVERSAVDGYRSVVAAIADRDAVRARNTAAALLARGAAAMHALFADLEEPM